MDLREAKDFNNKKHPWELSRLDAVKRILNGTVRDGLRVLDVGCGDGFMSRELFKGTGAHVAAVDSNFTDSQMALLSGLDRNIRYSRKIEGKDRYGLLLLLDVIEHVEEDLVFLKGLVDERLEKNGRVLVTAPAFNALFSGHDLFLGHKRRYSLQELSALVEKAGLRIISSGYLFTALLLSRAVAAAVEKAFGGGKEGGAGSWERGKAVTFLIKKALDLDNGISDSINRAFGLKVPGLTGWVLCERRR